MSELGERAARAASVRVSAREQDCSRCALIASCWYKALPDEIVVSLLVCRLERSIAREATTATLLKVLSRKIYKVAGYMKSRLGGDLADWRADVSSVVIEGLLSSYLMGELLPPLAFLFHERSGYVARWARRMVRTRATVAYNELSLDHSYMPSSPHDDNMDVNLVALNRAVTGHRVYTAPPWFATEPTADIDDARTSVKVADALAVVDDGHTLNAVEYRIMTFCLRATRGGVRPLETLHLTLSRRLKMNRRVVSATYARAWRKVVDAVGLRDQYLAARGVYLARRRGPLCTEDMQAVERALGDGITMPDVAWALGVSEPWLYKMRKRK